MKNNLTNHAQRRMQQRGITPLQVELLLAFGDDYYQKGGGVLTYMSSKKIAELRKAIDRLSRIALVKGGADQVVTIMHHDRKVRHSGWMAK